MHILNYLAWNPQKQTPMRSVQVLARVVTTEWPRARHTRRQRIVKTRRTFVCYYSYLYFFFLAQNRCIDASTQGCYTNHLIERIEMHQIVLVLAKKSSRCHPWWIALMVSDQGIGTRQ